MEKVKGDNEMCGKTTEELMKDLFHVIDEHGLDTEVEFYYGSEVLVITYLTVTGGFQLKRKES